MRRGSAKVHGAPTGERGWGTLGLLTLEKLRKKGRKNFGTRMSEKGIRWSTLVKKKGKNSRQLGSTKAFLSNREKEGEYIAGYVRNAWVKENHIQKGKT